MRFKLIILRILNEPPRVSCWSRITHARITFRIFRVNTIYRSSQSASLFVKQPVSETASQFTEQSASQGI